MAVIVAMQGQYNKMNTINARADAGVKSGLPVMESGVVSRVDNALSEASSLPVYKTPSVETTISFAGMPAMADTVALQCIPIGSITGLTALPSISRYESCSMSMAVASWFDDMFAEVVGVVSLSL